jgi:hypothetical protein
LIPFFERRGASRMQTLVDSSSPKTVVDNGRSLKQSLSLRRGKKADQAYQFQ